MLHFRRIRISLGPGNKRLNQGKRDFPWKKLHFYLENFRGFRRVCGSQDVMRRSPEETEAGQKHCQLSQNKDDMALRIGLLSFCEISDVSEVSLEKSMFSNCR